MEGPISEPSIILPLQSAHVSFNEPLDIKWHSNGQEVKRFYLRVGTSDNRFDLFSAEVSERINRLLLDISSLPANVESLYLNLAYTQMVKDTVKVKDSKTDNMVDQDIVEEVEIVPEDALVIYRKKE